MDANQTRFHLLQGRADWPFSEQDTGLDWDAESDSVMLERLQFLFQPPLKAADIPLEQRRGAACDQYGNWFWIAESEQEIRMLPAGSRESRPWYPGSRAAQAGVQTGAGDFRPLQPAAEAPVRTFRGLAITEDHYLVAGLVEPPGLVVFDLHAGGAPAWLYLPGEAAFAPFDLAPRPGGGVWVLDRDNGRYWGFDRWFRVIGGNETVLVEHGGADLFHADGEEPVQWPDRLFPTGFALNLEAADGYQAAAVEGLPDGSVLILLRRPDEPSLIRRYRLEQKVAEFEVQIPADQMVLPPGETFLLRGYDFAFLPNPAAAAGQVDGKLFVVSAEGNQAFAFALKEGEAVAREERYLPMRHFAGRGLVRRGGDVCYDYLEQWVPLTEQTRHRYREEAQVVIGQRRTRIGADKTPALVWEPLDGKRPDCVWDRCFMDAAIPPGAAVRVESRAANSIDDLLNGEVDWEDEPAPYLRSGGAEIPYYEPYPADGPPVGAGTWELLLQRARGQYLQLRLTLRGNQRVTPRIRALRVYYDRFSFAREYLPSVYLEDQRSADFLERFLANVGGLWTSLEDRIAQAQMLFDVRSVPAEYLEWLGSWLGLAVESEWSEQRKRLLLAHAPELFNQRGTPQGLIRALRLATDPCPDDAIFTDDLAVELGRVSGTGPQRFRSGTLRLVESLQTLNPEPHRFTVMVPTRSYGKTGAPGPDPRVVERVVASEKPAHTLFEVKEYWAMFQVGYARLGIDTQLDHGARLAAAVAGNAYLSQSYLTYPHPWNVVDRTVVGRDRVRRLGKGEEA